MARQLVKNDVPELWRNRAKAGLCPVCGKASLEFDKGMKVYCSVKCRDEYASRYVWWTTIKDEVLKEKGRVCAKCGISEEKAKENTEEINAENLRKLIMEQKELLNSFRDEALVKLSEDFEKEFIKIMDDEKLAKEKRWHFPEDILKKYKFDSYPTIPSFDVDHINAIVNGGDEFDKNNLQVLCEECHKEKTRRDMLKRTKGNQKIGETEDGKDS